ncbi:Fc.00g036990.m01.CDS01 [Cosmosporella sp. VM-42]
MDAGMPMILPKGIVVNSNNIYKEVANYPIVPPDKVWEYWHVYTTTYKKLKDPTACRLENFWWHVWGSDRRFLKGSTLAKLYEEISTGSTAVPLKGPPNRWEGPDIPPLLRQIMEAVQAEEAKLLQPPQEPSLPGRSTRPSELGALKTLSSSASKPPPPHPILKKARGPSSSGPRPTARFVSPHGSEDEDDIPSSGSTAATGSEQPMYVVPSVKKKAAMLSTKKFSAAPAAAKRRPQMPKRRSSQSSGGSSAGSRYGSVQRSVHPIAEHSSEAVISPSEDSTSSSASQKQLVMSEKARGKQPVVPLRPTSERNGVPRKENQVPARQELPIIRRQDKAAPLQKPALPQAQSLIDLPSHPRRGSAASRPTFGKGSRESGSIGLEAPPMMARSHSHTGYNYSKQQTTRRPPAVGLFTGATASTTNIAVQGTILDQSGMGSLPLPSILDHGEPTHHLPIQRTSSSILDSRLTPTQPSTSASVPLGRTKSQLTLLLERERTRNGNKPRSKG